MGKRFNDVLMIKRPPRRQSMVRESHIQKGSRLDGGRVTQLPPISLLLHCLCCSPFGNSGKMVYVFRALNTKALDASSILERW